MNRVIPRIIYVILLSITGAILFLFLFYFGPDKFSFRDIAFALFANVLGILVTLFLVERIINNYYKKEWEEFDTRIKNRLVDFLIYSYNILFLHVGKMEDWIKINNSEDTIENKVLQYSKLLEKPIFNDDYIKKVNEDSHLNKWYSDAYDLLLKRNEKIYQGFHTRLNHKLLPLILDLNAYLPNIISDLGLNYGVMAVVKNEKLVLGYDLNVRIKDDLTQIINVMNRLSKIISKN